MDAFDDHMKYSFEATTVFRIVKHYFCGHVWTESKNDKQNVRQTLNNVKVGKLI